MSAPIRLPWIAQAAATKEQADARLWTQFTLRSEKNETAVIVVAAATVDEGRALAEEAAERRLGGSWAMENWGAWPGR